MNTALDRLFADGYKSFSMRSLASALGVAPGAIYTYFSDKDELLNALADEVLTELWVDCDPDIEWKASLRKWMRELRAALLGAAGLKDLIALRVTSPVILEGFVSLAELMERAGLPEADAARTAQHLILTVFGFVFLELDALQPELMGSIASVKLRPEFARFTRHVVTTDYDPLYELAIRNAIAGIEREVGDGEPTRSLT